MEETHLWRNQAGKGLGRGWGMGCEGDAYQDWGSLGQGTVHR